VSILASSLTLGAADYSWRDRALCRDTDPELFFPVGTTGTALVQIERAKQVCFECTARVECLDFALSTNQDSGVWGGMSEEERRVIRRRRASQARNRDAI
jgi:WhiB family redox-sensing transcriptional regulator